MRSHTPNPALTALRSGTKEVHAKLETRVALESFGASRDNYIETLRYFLGVWEPLDDRLLEAAEMIPSELSLRERARAHLIKDDLSKLGLSQTEVDGIPRLGRLPPLESRAAALGAMYVTEGSTLGGQTISKKVAELGIFADSGASFFTGHGAETVTYWRKYCGELETLLSTEEEIEEAVVEATRTFQKVYDWFPEINKSASDQALASV